MRNRHLEERLNGHEENITQSHYKGQKLQCWAAMAEIQTFLDFIEEQMLDRSFCVSNFNTLG